MVDPLNPNADPKANKFGEEAGEAYRFLVDS